MKINYRINNWLNRNFEKFILNMYNTKIGDWGLGIGD